MSGHTHTHTHIHTYTHDNYYNPRCAHAHRGLINIYMRAVRQWSNLVPRRVPLNAQRANVGPASNDSKVNNIALKTATLVLCFS